MVVYVPSTGEKGMSCKANVQSKIVPPYDMEDGHIAVVTTWTEPSSMVGKIVQRYGNALIILGAQSGEAFGDVSVASHCRVQILDPGDSITIEQHGVKG